MAKRSIEGIIYDYDGLLVDTEDVWFRSCQKVCSQYGVKVTEEHRLELMRSQLSAYLVQRFELPTAADELRPILYGEVNGVLSKGIPIMPGAIHSLDVLGARYPLGIGTGSRTEQVESGLVQIGIRDRFIAVVGSDQVASGKPAPDIYLKTAENMGLDPEACLVFEDQPKGIAAAKAAGMLCVAVPNLLLSGVDYSHADRVIPDLGKVSLGIILEIEAASA